jgi:MFS transporter, PPP family, 3-phenylpropionic acid transporter
MNASADATATADANGRTRFALSYFALFAIYGVSTPYLQILVRGLGYGPAAVGLFLGLFEVVGIVGPLALSRPADASGRYKPTLFACAVLTCAPLAPLVLIRGPVATTLCLVVLSLGLRSMVPIMDASTVAMTTRRRGWDYGALRATGSAGFVVVALVLQLQSGFDRSPAGRIALWIGAVAVVFGLCLLFLPESGRAAAPPREAPASPSPSVVAGRGRGTPGVFVLGLAIIALGRLAMAPVNSFFSLYLVDEVKWDAVGGMWALAATAEIPLMLLSGRIISKLGPMRATMLGTAAIALRLAIYAFFPNPAGVVAAQLLHSLCFGLLHPAGVAFVTLTIPPERRAQGMAAYMGIGVGLPAFAGSALGGIVLQGWGYRALFGSFIVFALAAMCLYFARRRALRDC